MNEAPWTRLLSQIRDACVVLVIGPELLVGGGGEAGVSVPAYKNGAPEIRGAVVSVQP